MAEVRYPTWTGMLRQPVFLRLRDDKAPDECRAPEERAREMRGAAASGAGVEGDGREPPSADRASAAGEKKVPFTNLGKIFWPDAGYTKGDLIEYYRAISPWLLPYLKDRLLGREAPARARA